MPIKKLDEITIKNIAAGEVIESPLSIVKELIENSLDAKAESVKVYLDDSGNESIEVVDDGTGIEYNDLPNAIERYATSKINSIDDLNSLSTLGFRGEALASICSISTTEIYSKHQNEDIGGYLKCENGIIKEHKKIAYGKGTTVKVYNIFNNVPARKKFLNHNKTHITDYVYLIEHFYLANIHVGFSLYNNKSLVIKYDRSDSYGQAIKNVYGTEIYSLMHPINVRSETFYLYGYSSDPSLTRGSTDSISFFVNKRWILSKELINALREGYGTFIPKGRFPYAVVYIETHSSNIDVNIHPRKTEIKFYKEQDLRNMLSSAIYEMLKSKSIISTKEIIVKEKKKVEEKKEEKIADIPNTEPKTNQNILSLSEKEKKYEISKSGRLPKLRIIGQALNTFILGESEDNMLIIIDQHAASERIRYEELKQRKTMEQHLIDPVLINLPTKESEYLSNNTGVLEPLGFNISYMGSNTFMVRSLPSLNVKKSSAEISLLIQDLLSNELSHEAKFEMDRAIKTIACHSAIRAGDKLSMESMEALIKKLYSLDINYSCPHGRPVMIAIDKNKLGRMFLRS
ncbi:MAG: DNA mismatch repair endonuclease MutL [Thermoplasmata archaeon]